MKALLCSTLAFLAAAAGTGQQTDPFQYWRRPAAVRSIDIRATLDRDGRLHVVERQRLRITAANDGASRQIVRSLRRGIELRGVSLVEGDALNPLERGELTEPGRYRFETGTSTILWTFDSETPEQTFQLEYTLVDALAARPGGYRIAYDALPRTAYAEARALVTLDPAWAVVPDSTAAAQPLDLTLPVEKRPLLRYVGSGEPAFVPPLAPDSLRRRLTIAIGAGCLILALLFVRHEWIAGRLRVPRPPLRVDAGVVRDDLLSLFPQLEQPGGTADDSSVLARMIVEGKVLIHLHSGVSDQMHLLLVRSRDELSDEERAVSALIFGAGYITSTSKLRRPRRFAMTPRDTTHWSTRVLVIAVWAYFMVGSCFSTGHLTSAELLYQVFAVGLSPLFFIAVSIAGNARWYAAGPTRLLVRAVGFGAIPPAVITLLVNQDRVLLPPELYFSAAILAVSTFADALQAARSSGDEAGQIERRQRAIAVAEALDSRLSMTTKIEEHGFTARASGLGVKHSAAVRVVGLVATGMLIAGLVIGARGNDTLAHGLLYASFVTFLVAVIAAARNPHAPGMLQSAASPPPPPGAVPAVAPPRWEGRIDEGGAGVTARYGRFTWTLTSEVRRLRNAGSERQRWTQPFTLWRSNEGAIGGTLVFRPRHVSARGLDELLWLPIDMGISATEIGQATPMPVDDEHLLLHYTVLSSENLNATHISPALRATLTHLGEALREKEALPVVRGLAMIAFNSRGTVLLSYGASDSEAAVRTFATAGLQVAAALRPRG